MKKIITVGIIALLLSFTTNDAKIFKVEGTFEAWENVMQVIDKSNAPHLQVKAAQDFLLRQLQAQLDTTKKK